MTFTINSIISLFSLIYCPTSYIYSSFISKLIRWIISTLDFSNSHNNKRIKPIWFLKDFFSCLGIYHEVFLFKLHSGFFFDNIAKPCSSVQFQTHEIYLFTWSKSSFCCNKMNFIFSIGQSPFSVDTCFKSLLKITKIRSPMESPDRMFRLKAIFCVPDNSWKNANHFNFLSEVYHYSTLVSALFLSINAHHQFGLQSKWKDKSLW